MRDSQPCKITVQVGDFYSILPFQKVIIESKDDKNSIKNYADKNKNNVSDAMLAFVIIVDKSFFADKSRFQKIKQEQKVRAKKQKRCTEPEIKKPDYKPSYSEVGNYVQWNGGCHK